MIGQANRRAVLTAAGTGVATFAILVGASLVADTTGRSDPSGEPHRWWAGWGTDLPVPSPMNSVVGLGKTLGGQQRDDTIALWEAYRRERVVENCMAEAGFDYRYRDIVQKQDLATIEIVLDIQLDSQRLPRETEPALDDTEYSSALYGQEGVSDRDPERGDPGGGCDGLAWNKIPGIWVLKNHMAQAQADMFVEVNHDLAPAMARFAACAMSVGVFGVERPEHLRDAESAGDLTVQEVARVGKMCSADFEAEHEEVLFRAEQKLLADFATEVAEQRRQYENVLLAIAGDSGFLNFLEGP